jgi:hypothetical protein
MTCDFFTCAGIHQPVHLIAVPACHVNCGHQRAWDRGPRARRGADEPALGRGRRSDSHGRPTDLDWWP